MTIASNNSIRFNMSLDFWEMKRYKAEDLLGRWEDIYENAKDDPTEDAGYFLSDCMDVLYVNVLALPEPDRNNLLDRACSDMKSYKEKYGRGVA